MTPGNETVTVIRAAGKDRFGDPDPAQPATEHDVPGCALAPRGDGSESVDRSDTVVRGYELFTPAGADLLSTDQVRARGVVWDIVGEPGLWQSPFESTPAGLQVALQKAKG